MSQNSSNRDEIDKKIAYLITRTRDVSDGLVDADTVASLEDLARRTESPAVRVVVVGEVSRGKSTLINALIGRTLMPDAAQALTATWSILRHGPELSAVAYLATATGAKAVIVENTQIDTYMTESGLERVQRRHGVDARVASVEIRLPAPVLTGGLELIDTPGVGGLAAAHRYATLAALGQADAVVFVIKPGEPISATERRFLAEAVGKLETCIVVQTHRDQVADADAVLKQDMATLRSAAQWEALLADPDLVTPPADPKEEAARLAARFASTKSVSVSALNALRAAADPADPVNAQLYLDSGVQKLTELLNDVVASGDTVHRRNILLLIDSIIAECRR